MIKNFINDDRKGILSGYPNIVRRAKGNNAHNTGKEGLLLQDFWTRIKFKETKRGDNTSTFKKTNKLQMINMTDQRKTID